jgi:heme-binding uptake protein ChaN (Tiki superfamily)
MRHSSKTGERRSAAQMHAIASVRREIISRDNSGGRKYLREYTQAFRSYDGTLTPEQLEAKIAGSDLLLVGDYHALAASQRYAANLIEQVAPNRKVVLGVEAILSRDQALLDAWWRREIAEQELRKRLRFDHEWGYPWEPFLELLMAARDHAEGAYGLDCLPRNDMRRIRSRDRHAAAKIREMREHHPGAAMIVLFGESHLAPEHLPRLLKQSHVDEKVLTILQNVDALYWKAVGEGAAAVTTGAETVCVFNSSPVEKYESYRLCLERWNGEEQPDFAPAVYNVIFSLARTIGFRLDSPHNGTQPKYLADALPEIVNVEGSDVAPCDVPDSAGEKPRDLQRSLEEQGCCYDATGNRFFIREFQMPQVAAEAARFLHCACKGPVNLTDRRMEEALARFGSRLLCPETAVENGELKSAGELLYECYVSGKISPAAIRKLFLRGTDAMTAVEPLISAANLNT